MHTHTHTHIYIYIYIYIVLPHFFSPFFISLLSFTFFFSFFHFFLFFLFLVFSLYKFTFDYIHMYTRENYTNYTIPLFLTLLFTIAYLHTR